MAGRRPMRQVDTPTPTFSSRGYVSDFSCGCRERGGMEPTVGHPPSFSEWLPRPQKSVYPAVSCVGALAPHATPFSQDRGPRDQPRRENWRRGECLLLPGRAAAEQKWDAVLLGGLRKVRQTASLPLPCQGAVASGMTKVKGAEGQPPNRHPWGLCCLGDETLLQERVGVRRS